MKMLIVSLLLLSGAAGAADLPKVLLVGDSISVAYTPHVTRMLKDEAQVVHHKGNAGPTIRGVERIEQWLGTESWDVIHFNFGLWDMYGWEYVDQDRSPAMYEKRLQTLVARLKKTGAQLIWATTTPACPEPERGMDRRWNTKVVIDPAVEKQYLDTARKVMNAHQIPINDLHALIKPQLAKYAKAANDVHYTREGSELLAEQVADAIRAVLPVKEAVER